MAIIDDRDAFDAVWYATDAIGNSLEKIKKNTETLKDCCYNIDWNNAHGLGEQRRYAFEDWNLKELRLPKLKLQNNKVPTREEIEKKIKRYSMHDIFNGRYTFHYRYTCEDGYKIESQCSISAQAFVVPTLTDTEDTARKQRIAVNEIINKALKHYNEKYYTEVCNMTTMQFEKFDTALRAMHGNLSIELDGMNNIAHIDVPLMYLKYFDIKMPTTDFCVSKRTDTGNWINGLPAIKKIETYNDRVVKVTFTDDTFTKSVCSENDHFDLDVGITICCMKKLLGKDGNRIYNDMIRKAHKVIIENDIAKEKAAKEKAERKLKNKLAAKKKAEGKLKARQEQIDIQAEAIIQAHDALEARNSEA